jgi:hypothetical protein
MRKAKVKLTRAEVKLKRAGLTIAEIYEAEFGSAAASTDAGFRAYLAALSASGGNFKRAFEAAEATGCVTSFYPKL